MDYFLNIYGFGINMALKEVFLLMRENILLVNIFNHPNNNIFPLKVSVKRIETISITIKATAGVTIFGRNILQTCSKL